MWSSAQPATHLRDPGANSIGKNYPLGIVAPGNCRCKTLAGSGGLHKPVRVDERPELRILARQRGSGAFVYFCEVVLLSHIVPALPLTGSTPANAGNAVCYRLGNSGKDAVLTPQMPIMVSVPGEGKVVVLRVASRRYAWRATFRVIPNAT